jgi:hypothetical protein
MKKLVLTFTLILVMSLVVVATAFAAYKDTVVEEYDEVYPVDYCGDVGVGDFWIYNNEVGTARLDYFYDNDGNLTRVKGHVNGTDHLFAEGYSDKVIDGTFVANWTDLVDPLTGEPTFSHNSGNWWHLNLPGYGNVVHITGMENYQYDPDTEEWYSIKWAGLEFVDRVAVCEYLAPPP